MQLFGAAAGLFLEPQACGPRRRRGVAAGRIPAHAFCHPALVAAALLAEGHPEARGDGHRGCAHDSHVELDHDQHLEGGSCVGEVRVQARGLVEHDDAGDRGYNGTAE